MAKKIIKISKGGSPSAVTQNIAAPRGPRAPIRLNTAPPPEPEPVVPQKKIITAASKARAASAEPQKRIITAASRNRISAPSAAPQPAQQNAAGRQPPPKKKQSGPPLWLIPVGIFGLVVVIVIIVSVSSNSRRDPYFETDAMSQYPEKKAYVDPRNRPRPMKEYMEKHGPSDMAKSRMERMKKRPTTTATQSSN